MSAISEYAVKQNEYNTRVEAATRAVTADVAELNRLIGVLQTTPGPISPEDQATLDTLQARGLAMAEGLEALDALTPPPVPTDPAARGR